MNALKMHERMHMHLDSAGITKGTLPDRVVAACTWLKYMKDQLEVTTFEVVELRQKLKAAEHEKE